MKIAVTSASGQLGGAIVKELLNDLPADQVIAIARTPEKAMHLGVEARKGDYNSQEEFIKAFKGVEKVLLVSANGNPMDRIPMHRNVIAAAKEAGVRKMVYTSVAGNFGEVVPSNRQTEEDLRNSGLDWVIGRNGIYIEPDVEYMDHYKKAGKITNCAADGKCAYTTRSELAIAYKHLLLEEQHNGHTYYLSGEPITQDQLADYLNRGFGTQLTFESMSIEAYRKERTAELGEFLGGVIAAIYESIRNGDFDVESDYEKATGRPHVSWETYFGKMQN